MNTLYCALSAIVIALFLCPPLLRANPDAARANSAGIRHHEQGRYQQAVDAFRQALTHLPVEDHQVARVLNNLGGSLEQLTRYKEAREVLDRALKVQERIFGGSHPNLATTLNNLATLARRDLDFTGSMRALRRAIAMRDQLSDRQLAVTLHNLGAVSYDTRQRKAAEKYFRESIALYERVEGRDSPSNAPAFSFLAKMLADSGRTEEAEQMQKRSLFLREAGFGQNHPLSACSVSELGEIYALAKRSTDAEAAYREALARFERAGASGHAGYAATTFRLAELLRSRDRLQEALPLYERVVTFIDDCCGVDNRNLIYVLRAYSAALKQVGRKDEAKTVAHRAADIAQRNPLDASVGTVVSLSDLVPRGAHASFR